MQSLETLKRHVISLERTGQPLIPVVLAIVVFILIALAPLPTVHDGTGAIIPLSSSGRTSLAILGFCMILWITEAVPFAVTGLAIFFLFPALGVATPAEIAGNGLGHPVMLFFLSLFILSSAFMQVGLSHRIGNWVLTLSRGYARRLILVALAAGAFLTMGTTALAATSVLVSTALEILERTQLSAGRSNFGRALLMTTCWGPLIGSLGTPAGAGSNPLTIGYLHELTGLEISFLDWMTFGVPSVLLLVPIAWLILSYLFPPEQKRLLSPTELAAIEAENHQPLTRQEKTFLVVYGLTLFLWIAGPAIQQATGGRIAPTLQNVGLAAALVLFIPGLDLVSWSSAEHDIHWGTLLVLAGGLATGVMLYHTGAARWLAWGLLGPVSGVAPLMLVITMIAAICLLRLLFSSSTAATAILIPLVIVMAQDLQLDPWLFTAPAAFAINLAFILPTQAATHMVAYSAGHFSSKDLARGGLLFTLIAVPVVLGVIFAIAQLAGQHLIP